MIYNFIRDTWLIESRDIKYKVKIIRELNNRVEAVEKFLTRRLTERILTEIWHILWYTLIFVITIINLFASTNIYRKAAPDFPSNNYEK